MNENENENGNGNDEVWRRVRAHVAFEHMIAAVLMGAALSGAALLALSNFFLLAKGAWSVGSFGGTVFGALRLAMLVFLIGFGAAVAVGVPLFQFLERIRMRRAWPYALAALAVQYGALWIVTGRQPLGEPPATFLFFAPGLLIAWLFARRIRPVWRAAERAESAESGAIVRLQ
ncbi:hypothetical protein [Amphiplicatus metriothermophilus]|uniref:Uncharacterized protein n=1 Tax=Amphiplicatus metriothermophilus TaxID=1519374 RepID=A0A239PYL2_9PROT|nr:hypothetical protein [Amphiplicatus metriothermophilus]MBB5519067.1 hypothetical protein [Amphiplicatus metriothermophilus]SNT74757.1 hypothetical protein SAMN06297382_2345 [Amphiplicatus metriothermophilus]